MNRIRVAQSKDAESLPAIERSAAEAFLALPDLAWIAGRDVDSAGQHLAAMTRGPVWVAVDDSDAPLAFLSAEVVGDHLHLCELSVRRECQQQGIGRALVKHATRWTRDRGLSALTLTTFRDVAWNAPFYRRLGFEILAPSEISPDLVLILGEETSRGLPTERRCAMRLVVRGS